MQSGRLELDNNASERALRGVSMLADQRILQTADGACAYADLMTLCGTCIMNGVDFGSYLAWLFACVKLRVEVGRARDGDPRLRFWQLKTSEVRKWLEDIGAAGPGMGVRYNPKYDCPYDKIDPAGLTVWDYKRMSNSTAEG